MPPKPNQALRASVTSACRTVAAAVVAVALSAAVVRVSRAANTAIATPAAPAPAAPAPAAPAPAAAGVAPARAELAARCDELLRSAVRNPYGWGWAVGDALDNGAAAAGGEAGGGEEGDGGRAAKPRQGRAPRPARMQQFHVIDARETALIGLELCWAGDLLGGDRAAQYRQAALEAARGLAAIQMPSGQVRSRGTPGLRSGGTKDAAADVPDRSVTIDALGLWLTLLDSTPSEKGAPRDKHDGEAGTAAGPNGGAAPPPRDERLVRPAAAATRWLIGQQTPPGAWLANYPPDAPRKTADRIVRLDTRDFRDAALALLVSGEVLDNRGAREFFERSLDNLLAMRIPCGINLSPVLWAGAYNQQGQPNRRYPEFNPGGVDLMASRHALQVLLAAYLVTLKPTGDAAVREAVAAISKLPREAAAGQSGKAGEPEEPGSQGRLYRYYDRQGRPSYPPRVVFEPRAVKLTPGQFPTANAGDRKAEQANQVVETADLDGVLQLSKEIADAGGVQVAKRLASGRSLDRRLVEMMCGLSEDALAGRIGGGPTSRPVGAPAGGPADGTADGASGSGDIPGRAAEVWRLLCRAEGRGGKS